MAAGREVGVGPMVGSMVALGADIELEMRLDGQIGRPYTGFMTRQVSVPTPVRPAASVTTELGGFALTCSGKKRTIAVELAYDVRTFPENPPTELGCDVGEHHLVIRLVHDLEVAYRIMDHLTIRASLAWSQTAWRIPPGVPDGPGRLVDAAYGAAEGMDCRIEDGMLRVDRVGPVTPGGYRCVVEGQAPIPIEILP